MNRTHGISTKHLRKGCQSNAGCAHIGHSPGKMGLVARGGFVAHKAYRSTEKRRGLEEDTHAKAQNRKGKEEMVFHGLAFVRSHGFV